MNKNQLSSIKSCWLFLTVFFLSILFANLASADSWIFDESGYTTGCETSCAPGTQCNGPYHAGFTLDVSTSGETLRGVGWCVGQPYCDPPLSTYLWGSSSESEVAFLRWGAAFTPGFLINWDYSGTISGSELTGSFRGPGNQADPYARGCYTRGTFSVKIIKGNSSIAGRIALTNGVGFSAAEVYAYRSRCGSGDAAGGTLAMEFGDYRIQSLTPGNYYVMSRSKATNHVPTWWNGGSGTKRCEQALKINLANYEKRSGIDIVLKLGGSASGGITDSSGTPIEGQIIYATLDRCNTKNSIATDAVSNSYGRYFIQGLPAGSVYLFTYRPVKEDQFEMYWWNRDGGQSHCGSAEPADILVNQNNPGYDFVLP